MKGIEVRVRVFDGEEWLEQETYLEIDEDAPYSVPSKIAANAAAAMVSSLTGEKTSPQEGGR